MKFRPCIDIHNGKVKQIVGGSLKDAGDQAKENFVSGQDAAFYAELYKNAGLKGGHVILLNGKDSEYYEATRNQALKALKAYPGGLQIGGGVCQVSSTMYNAVVKAGLKTTMRRKCTGLSERRSKPCHCHFLCVQRWETFLGKSRKNGAGSRQGTSRT